MTTAVHQISWASYTRTNGISSDKIWCLQTNVGVLDEPSNDGYADFIYPVASLLNPNYGFVWLEDDLPVSVAVKESLQQRLIDTITKEAESCCVTMGNCS